MGADQDTPLPRRRWPHIDDAPAPSLDEPAALLIAALRVACGGSVVATRSMFAQAEDEFPLVQGVSVMLTAFDHADNERPTRLLPDTLAIFRAVYSALRLPSVEADVSLQIAIRRLILAGSRTNDTDRLIDLAIATEALFVKRANLPGVGKRDKIAAGAAALFGTDKQLNADPNQISDLMDTLYQARNAEIHGDGEPYPRLHRLSGAPTTSLAATIQDAERVTRRAVLAILTDHAGTPQPPADHLSSRPASIAGRT